MLFPDLEYKNIAEEANRLNTPVFLGKKIQGYFNLRDFIYQYWVYN